MSFKFNFNIDTQTPEVYISEITSFPTDLDATIIKVSCEHKQFVPDMEVCELAAGKHRIKYISSEHVEEKLKTSQSPISAALKHFSDLIPNVYEGGLKIWECSMDLLKFLENLEIHFSDCNVLELGCGAGLPTLYAYVSGASCCFQDYNSEVINLVTIPNVILNAGSHVQDYNQKATFVAGDWSHVSTILNDNPKFDLILTSETIYNVKSQQKLINVMKSLLKKQGTIYLAAKTCYFGVGGSLRQFEQLLTTDGTFNYNTVWKTTEGVQREILQLSFKDA